MSTFTFNVLNNRITQLENKYVEDATIEYLNN